MGTDLEPYSSSENRYYSVNYEYRDYIALPEYYDASGRGYPDVALFGHAYLAVYDQEFGVVDGTSASTPVFAGMVSLLNSARLKAGMSKMGFLNPFLYGYYQNFTHDITSGDNKCTEINFCDGDTCYANCCKEGFYATNGWDPMTGLGSINFEQFLITALNVANASATVISSSTLQPTMKPTIVNQTTSPSLMPLTFSPSVQPVVSPTTKSSVAPSLSPASQSDVSVSFTTTQVRKNSIPYFPLLI
jgi:subtilase family serine protease